MGTWMADEPTVHVENVSKRFDKTVALDGVSLDVRPGEVPELVRWMRAA